MRSIFRSSARTGRAKCDERGKSHTSVIDLKSLATKFDLNQNFAASLPGLNDRKLDRAIAKLQSSAEVSNKSAERFGVFDPDQSVIRQSQLTV